MHAPRFKTYTPDALPADLEADLAGCEDWLVKPSCRYRLSDRNGQQVVENVIVSPDGSRLAYTSNIRGGSKLFTSNSLLLPLEKTVRRHRIGLCLANTSLVADHGKQVCFR